MYLPTNQLTAEQTYRTTLHTKDYDPPCLASFIIVVSAATAVATTVQKFIVVVSAATAVATTVQKFIVRKEGRKGRKEGQNGSLN